jgi:hypothetical protein
MSYNIAEDPKLSEDRKADWKQFNDKYPPRGSYDAMGRAPLVYEKNTEPTIDDELPRNWTPLRIKDRTLQLKNGVLTLDIDGKTEEAWLDYKDGPKERKRELLTWKVVAGPPGSAVGSSYYRDIADTIITQPIKKETRVRKKTETKTKLETLSDCLDCSPKRIKDDVIEGSRGRVRHDGDKITVLTDPVTKRKFSSIKKQLGFADLVSHKYDSDQGYEGKWSLSNPTLEQASVIRKVVGLRKSSTLSDTATV